MDIKDFIVDAITQIAEGIKDLQKDESELGIIVNPNLQIGSSDKRYVPTDPDHFKIDRYIQNVKFEIGVVVNNEQIGGGKGGLNVAAFKLGAGLEVKNIEENVNRLTFSIPVCLPTTKIEKK